MKILKNVLFLSIFVLTLAVALPVAVFAEGKLPDNSVAIGETSSVSVLSVNRAGGKGIMAAIASIFTNTRTVKWTSKGFPEGAKVNVNLIRKVSESPVSYELVRQIEKNAPNDGQAKWTPSKSETGDNLYIEVTCSDSLQIMGCRVFGAPVKAYDN